MNNFPLASNNSNSAERLAPPQVAITNRHLCVGDFLAQIARVAAAHPDAIILREKDLPEADYLALARQVMPLCAAQGVPLVAHHFADAAEALGIPALQLPFAEFVALAQAKRLSAFDRVGVSIHSAAQARQAEALGAHYLICGNIFATPSKPGLPARGLSFLREICESVGLPVYAIGGITDENAALCIAQGAAGICRMGYWMRLR